MQFAHAVLTSTLIKVFSYDCPFCFKYDAGVDPKVTPRIRLGQKVLELMAQGI